MRSIAFAVVLIALVIGGTTIELKRLDLEAQGQRKPHCDDIVRYQDGSLVCETDILAEDSASI